MASGFFTVDASEGGGIDVELEIKRSRFLTRIRRVTSEEDARGVIEERRSTHFDARHHCSAFILGPDGRTARSSDDGEPAGTAGIPMLTVLQRHELTDVVAVVTRYFGGIKLGAGGLVRAYSDAVAEAVAAVGRRRVERCLLFRIRVGFAEVGTIEDQLRGLILPSGAPLVVDEVEWSDAAYIRVAVPEPEADDLHIALATLSAGMLTADPVGSRWVG